MQDGVGLEHGVGVEVGNVVQRGVKRREVRLQRPAEQVLEAVGDEIGLLEVVDPVARAHDAPQVEGDAVGRGRVEREDALAETGDDAGAVKLQALAVADEAELHRIPVKPRQSAHGAVPRRAEPALAIGLHVVGEDRVGEQGDVAEDVVEDVGLLQVVALRRRADEPARDERSVGEVSEEDAVGHQAGHGDDAPAGELLQPLGQLVEVGNAGPRQLQHLEAGEEFRRGAALEHLRLAGEQAIPEGVLRGRVAGPILRDGPVSRGALRPAGLCICHAGTVAPRRSERVSFSAPDSAFSIKPIRIIAIT
jgi:hypothetical protein